VVGVRLVEAESAELPSEVEARPVRSTDAELVPGGNITGGRLIGAGPELLLLAESPWDGLDLGGVLGRSVILATAFWNESRL